VSADAGTAAPTAGLLTVVAVEAVEAIPRAPAAADFTMVSLAETKIAINKAKWGGGLLGLAVIGCMGRCCSIVAGYRKWVGAERRFAGVDSLTGVGGASFDGWQGCQWQRQWLTAGHIALRNARGPAQTNNVANGSLVEPRRTELRASEMKSSTPTLSRKRETSEGGDRKRGG